MRTTAVPLIVFPRRGFHLLATVAAFFAAAALSPVARAADTTFIDQIPNGQTLVLPPNAGLLLNSHLSGPQGLVPSFTAAPQFTAPRRGNSATTIEIGNNNSVFQLQTGTGDQSTVGIIGGNRNRVGVIQAGNNLESDLLLIGTQGMSVGVIEPNHSAPIRMAIIHVPAGTVIIPHYR
jgi:hypothetical protein